LTLSTQAILLLLVIYRLFFLTAIAAEWTALARSAPIPGFPGMADYGASPNNFLECVPTYVHAVAALQAGNTWSECKSTVAHIGPSLTMNCPQLT